MSAGKPFVRHLSDVTPVPCPCGVSARIITREDGCAVGLHVTELTDARKHYHRHTTEVYYVLEGEGEMEVGHERFAVRPGHAVHIPPGVAHRAVGAFKALIVVAPPFDPTDEHVFD